jgi:hypothetical protein
MLKKHALISRILTRHPPPPRSLPGAMLPPAFILMKWSLDDLRVLAKYENPSTAEKL